MASISHLVLDVVRNAAARSAARSLGPERLFQIAIRRNYAAGPAPRLTVAQGVADRESFLRANPSAAVPVPLDMVLEAQASADPELPRIGLLNDDPNAALAYAARMIEVYGPRSAPVVEEPFETEVVPLAPAPYENWTFASGAHRREPNIAIRRISSAK